MYTNYSELEKRKILVADDVELNQTIVRHIMEAWGFDVAIACNGVQVLEMVKAQAYDLILMDIQMPEMDGIAATRHIRSMKDQAKASIPIVALSASAFHNNNECLIAAGMNGFLSKPIIEEKLFEIIACNVPAGKPAVVTPLLQAPAAAVAPEGKLYDLSIIRSVSGGDGEFVRKMVCLFIETVPPNIKALENLTVNRNWEMVSKMAHKLKPTLDSMGIHALKQVVRTIECTAKSGHNTDAIPALVQQMIRVADACIVQLEHDVPENVSG